MSQAHLKGFVWSGLLLAFLLAACHKEEQAVVGVAQTAVKAEQKAQANATERDLQRTQLEKISLPTKSMYMDIHEPSAWANPYLAVGPETLTLRILQEGASGQPHRQELQVHPEDLAKALVDIPASAWHYGRVIAVAEVNTPNRKERPKARRNMEEAIKKLNDLGIVVEEWPAR